MKYKKIAISLLSIAFLAALWEFIAWRVNIPAIFPSLSELAAQIFALFGTKDFYLALSATIFRGIIGLFIAFSVSFLLAVLAAFSEFWKTFFQPIIVVLRSVPVISFVLLALFWFSPAHLPIFIALITVFPILYQSILTALNQTDIQLVEMAKIFGKTPVNRFFTIYLPASKNMIYDGISTAMGFGWRAIIIGEVLAQPFHGIGTGMKTAQAFIQMPKLMAWTIAAILVSYLFEILLQQVRKIKFSKKLPLPHPFLLEKKSISEKQITIEKLNKQFGQHIIFNNYTDVFTNETVNCIKGESGRGKTTLLRLISGLDSDYTGEIRLSNAYKLSYSFQENRLLPWLTVQENIAYIFDRKTTKKQHISDISFYLFEKLELTEHAKKYPHQLSGGQKQRVNLARALAAQSNIILLDEPLTGLDEKLKKQIIAFLLDWISVQKLLVIWATHENIEKNHAKIIAI
jgi:ABC-type nitrate/sulfonate/bicarbonate transport system ATPase subunit/ABC-type nitrate/sulfonate/bicarbonate transport system permease component